MKNAGCLCQKMIQAGMGAAALGAEKTQSTFQRLVQKGEPLYQNALQGAVHAAESMGTCIGKGPLGELLGCTDFYDRVMIRLESMPTGEIERLRKRMDEIIARRVGTQPAAEQRDG